jgi:hypothetical protein
MSIVITDFVPQDKLHYRTASTTATLSGSGLANNLTVNVVNPRGSKSPRHRWTGTTSNYNSATGTCEVVLPPSGDLTAGDVGDSPLDVSVVASDSTTQSNQYDTTVIVAN